MENILGIIGKRIQSLIKLDRFIPAFCLLSARTTDSGGSGGAAISVLNRTYWDFSSVSIADAGAWQQLRARIVQFARIVMESVISLPS